MDTDIQELLRELVPVLGNTGATQQSWLVVVRSCAARQSEAKQRHAAGSNNLFVDVARLLGVHPDFRGTETLVVPEPLQSRVDLNDAVGLIGGKGVAIERGEITCARLKSLSNEAIEDKRVGRAIQGTDAGGGVLAASAGGGEGGFINGGNRSQCCRTG